MNTCANTIPRPEHPNPQMKRKNWMNLNGEWDFSFDFGNSGIDRKLYDKEQFDTKICVPFCPESKLSGIEYKDFIPAVWYHRVVEIEEKYLTGRVLLHFGAVDYESSVWVNGQKVGVHQGGYSSFTLDITEYLTAGKNHLTVCAKDDTRSGKQPKGKQSEKCESFGSRYTRTTGIWQTVWLEFVPKSYIEKVWYYPNISQSSIAVKVQTKGSGTLYAEAFYEGRSCGSAEAVVTAGNGIIVLPLTELHLWEIGAGRLYELKLHFGEDELESYFGMREISLDGERFLINGKLAYQRLVLDQGYYPDGVYTAPDDESLEKDIQLSLEAGFNGARLHQKVFEPRFLYHCDRLGYLVWGETGNWGLDYSNPEALHFFLPEWMEVLERDFNHPSIVGWCPFNETWDYDGRKQRDSLLEIVYRMTKQYDTTRPCIDTSGNYHVITDIYDLHDAEPDPEAFRQKFASFAAGGELQDRFPDRQKAPKGIPVFISEYGGMRWDVDGTNEDSWGYGNALTTEEEYIDCYRGLTNALLDNPHMFGFCFIQLYDIEQEKNGLYTYNREKKFDMNKIREINTRMSAMEEREENLLYTSRNEE